MSEESKLITLDNLKLFSKNCKDLFDVYPIVECNGSEDNQDLLIESDVSYNNIHQIYVTLQADNLFSVCSFNLFNKNNISGYILNFGENKIISGGLYFTGNAEIGIHFAFDIRVTNVVLKIYFSKDGYNIYKNPDLYSSFVGSNAADNFQYSVKFNSEEIPVTDNAFTNFSIVNADGVNTQYSEDAVFNSIKYAGCLSKEKNFKLTGFVQGTVKSDLSSDVVIETSLNKSNSGLSDFITEKTQSALSDWKDGDDSYATELNPGLIKLGSNTSNSILNVKSSPEYGAYVELNSSKLPYLKQLYELPTTSPEYNQGDIVQYLGETTDKYTTGSLYKATVNESNLTIYNTAFKFSSGKSIVKAVDTMDKYPWTIIAELLRLYPGNKFEFVKNSDVWKYNNSDSYKIETSVLKTLFPNQENIDETIELSDSFIVYIINTETKVKNTITWNKLVNDNLQDLSGNKSINVSYDSSEYIYFDVTGSGVLTSINVSGPNKKISNVKTVKVLIHNSSSATVVLPKITVPSEIQMITLGSQTFFEDLSKGVYVELEFEFWQYNLVTLKVYYKN